MALLGLLIILLFAGAIIATIVSARRGARTASGQPVGIRGWLLLLAIAETIAPVRVANDAIQSFLAAQPVLTMPNGPAVVWGEVALNVVLALFTLSNTVLLWRRHPRFPRRFQLQWLLFLAGAAVEPAVVALALGVPIATVYVQSAVLRAIGTVLAAGLWVWYIQVSVRVRNTFNPPDRLRAEQTAVF